MKHVLLSAIVLLGVLALPYSAFGETTVTVSNTSGGSSTRVNIENKIDSRTSGMTSSETKNYVRVESNGQVKEYTSNKPENISLESDDGTAKVNITNDIKRRLSLTPAPTSQNKQDQEKIQKQMNAQKQALQKKKEAIKAEMNQRRFDINEFITSQLERIKRFFSFGK